MRTLYSFQKRPFRSRSFFREYTSDDQTLFILDKLSLTKDIGLLIDVKDNKFTKKDNNDKMLQRNIKKKL